VGEVVTFTYRLSRGLDRAVTIWTEVDPPSGESYEGGPIDFLPAQQRASSPPATRRRT